MIQCSAGDSVSEINSPGTFTGIGRDGTLVVQQVTRGTAGQGLFIGLLEAFRLVGGHMLSDVATPMGLPSPLLPLAQFLQFGNIGPEKYTIAETARRMYLEGYDFRHFVAGGLTTLIVEIIVRGAWLIRRLDEGRTFRASLPDAAMPRLRRQLLLAHATAAAVDGGKICITKNPIALNWAQWLAVLRYLVPEIEYSIRACHQLAGFGRWAPSAYRIRPVSPDCHTRPSIGTG